MDTSEHFDPRLADDLVWLRRFAERFARDPGLIDDACQEAMLGAAGAADVPGRSSLIRRLRSAIFRRRRSETRRLWHETRGALGAPDSRRSHMPSTDELLIRGEQCEALWRHVRGSAVT